MIAPNTSSVVLHRRSYLSYVPYFVVLFMVLSCKEVTNDSIVEKHDTAYSVVLDSQVIQAISSPGSIASIHYSTIGDQTLEIHVKNSSDGPIALIPTLYSLAVMEQGHIKATAASIGAIVYWDTTNAGDVVFEILEQGPRYQSDLPFTVVEVAAGQSVKFQFPIEQIIKKVGDAKRAELLLECLPVWQITNEFRRRISRSCIVANRNVVRMCTANSQALESDYLVCETDNCTITSRELYYWLCSEAQQVPALRGADK